MKSTQLTQSDVVSEGRERKPCLAKELPSKSVCVFVALQPKADILTLTYIHVAANEAQENNCTLTHTHTLH